MTAITEAQDRAPRSRFFASVLRFLEDLSRRRVASELERLSDRQLQDIGITRSEIRSAILHGRNR